MSDDRKSAESAEHHERTEETTRPDTPELEGGTPPPEELTGRASGTSEDLTALFENDTADHLRDGFRGGSGGDQDVEIPTEHQTDGEADEC